MIVKEIKVPIHIYESKNDWDSHLPLLYLAASHTKSHIVEFGMGLGSTPALSFYCNTNNISFFSFETNRDWYLKLIMLDCSKHLIDSYLEQDIGHAELLFIDSAPGEERKELIKKHKDNVNVIVVHDTEVGAEYVYGMSEILSTFKYRLDYQPEGKPHTTAVSNFIDVTKWITQD